ncbi:MAG: N-acetylmuramoyl-L-alanine amidase [Balneolaceae bacterium]|nr:N-acetylmuramoyl-L-alanine amidase [Balneolaceae bacterium]
MKKENPLQPDLAIFGRCMGLILALMLVVPFSAAGQQNILERISTAQRSDGMGHVVRFHLTESTDSFKVFQPSLSLIQLTLYSDEIDTTDIALPEDAQLFDEISFYDIPFGIGVDLYVAEGHYFDAGLYPDGESRDLLLGLTNTSRKKLEYLTEGLEPVIWSRFTVTEESLLVGNGSTEPANGINDDNYWKVKDKLKFDVVVIDPGHGGHDSGSVGYKNTYEKDIVLAIAKKVGGYIEEYLPDVKVVYTREDDRFVELEERGSIANRNEGDLFVSIHCNWHSNRYAYGSEVYFLGHTQSEAALDVMKRENSVVNLENGSEPKELTQEELIIYELANAGYMATSEKVAGMMEYQLDERAQRRSRGVKQAAFIVLYHASMPAVLVEAGFISNPSEQRYLTSDRGQAIVASAIFRAIRDYKVEYEKSQHFTNTN